MNLGALRRKEMYAEVRKAHDAIAAAAQVEPKGFISPAWSSSRELFDTLVECGYEYDTSIYPSWLLLPMVLRIAAGYRGTPKALRLLHRRDYLSSLVASRRPTLYHSKRGQHGDQDLCILPLPANRYRFPCWHTTGYMFGWEFQSRLLKSCLRDVEFFYYLTHPGDLVADDDLHPAHSHSLARLKVDLSLKTEHLEKMICQIVASGRKLVTLTEMQAAARERIAGKPQPVSESFATRRVSY
jgi:hypothetical protein